MHTELLFGIVAAVSANFSMSAPKKPTNPADFMPSLYGKKKARLKTKNRKAIATDLRCFLLAAKDVREKGLVK